MKKIFFLIGILVLSTIWFRTPDEQEGSHTLVSKQITKRNKIENSVVASTQTKTDVENQFTERDEALSQSQANKAELMKLLGDDAIGKTAIALLDKNIANQFGALDPHPKINCQHQETCPVPLEQLFTESLDRIPNGPLSEFKARLQDEMLVSDLSRDVKSNLLSRELVSEEFRSIEPSSGRAEDGTPYLGPEANYVLATQVRLLSFTLDSDTAISSSLTAISNVQDPPAKMLLAINLLSRYSSQREEIYAELEELGLDRKLIDGTASRIQSTLAQGNSGGTH